jgi:2,3-bisphosphoglycerate-dependent phosphoglycerate mutase
MQLFFIRHGQSENNRLWDNTGGNKGRSDDPELTEAGHQQAQLLGQFIKKKDDEAKSNGSLTGLQRDYFGFTHLYTSLMVRSVVTGTYVARALGMRLAAWPEIHECGGIFMDDVETGKPVGRPGKARSFFLSNFEELVLPETVAESGWWDRPFEAYEDRPLRAQKVLAGLLERHGGSEDRVGIISHGGFYMELIRVMFKLEQQQSWFLMNNTAVSRFDFEKEGRITLVYHNRTEHLPPNLVT